MLHQRALLPVRTFGILAGVEMRTADSDHAVEGQRIVRREIERDLEAFDRRLRVALVDVDPSRAAPRPGRSAVHGERPANDEIGGIELAEQRQRVAEHGQHGGVTAQCPCLVRQFEAAGALLHRRMREVIDHALDMRPCRQRVGERMVRILVHRTLEHFQRAGIAGGVERKNARHRTQREIMRVEAGRRLS